MGNIDNMVILWVALVIFFGVIEGATANLTSIWLVVGAVAALIVTALGGEIWLQILSFLVVTGLTLWLTRPLVKALVNSKKVNTNADRVLDMIGVVTATVDNVAGTGTVRVDGMDWTARSEDGSIIPVGERVSSVRIEGVKIIVRPEVVPAEAAVR